LGMNATTFFAEEAQEKGQLSQSWIASGRRIPFWFSPEPEAAESIAGPGGIISNAGDMGKWIAMLLNRGVDPCTNTTIIPLSIFEETTMAHCITEGTGTDSNTSIEGYGMGWTRMSYKGHEIVAHGGGVPGFSSIVMFLPAERVGVVTLTNRDGLHGTLRRIALHAVNGLLDLQHGSDDLISIPPLPTNISQENTTDSQQVVAETLPEPLEKYVGTYSNPGYGTFTLYAASSVSSAAEEVLADFSTCSEIIEDGPALYAAWPRMWSSHIRLRHRTKNMFSFSHSYLFPKGYGKDTTPFAYKQLGELEPPAEFELCDGKVIGFGILDIVFDSRRVPKTEGDVQERADLWFAKVN